MQYELVDYIHLSLNIVFIVCKKKIQTTITEDYIVDGFHTGLSLGWLYNFFYKYR